MCIKELFKNNGSKCEANIKMCEECKNGNQCIICKKNSILSNNGCICTKGFEFNNIKNKYSGKYN